MSGPEYRPRSSLWFLLPFFFGILGGAIAFLAIRKDDPKRAKSCLLLGVAMLLAGIALNLFWILTVPDAGPDFAVNL